MTATATAPLVLRDTDDPPLAGDTPNGRYYRLTPDGPLVYPSITNVKGIRNSEPLNGWKVKMAGNRALDWVMWLARLHRHDPAKVGPVLDKFLDNDNEADRWVRKVKRAHVEHADARAARGSKVHLAVEAILTGQPITVDAAPEPVDAFRKFAVDFDLHVVEVEATVVNHTHRYAGTGDLLARVGGSAGPLAIVDWKSRGGGVSGGRKKPGIFAETALQLAALRYGEFLLRADGTQDPWPRPEIGIAVALGDDGNYYAHQMDVSETVFAQFCAARVLFDFAEQAKGPAITSPAQLRV